MEFGPILLRAARSDADLSVSPSRPDTGPCTSCADQEISPFSSSSSSSRSRSNDLSTGCHSQRLCRDSYDSYSRTLFDGLYDNVDGWGRQQEFRAKTKQGYCSDDKLAAAGCAEKDDTASSGSPDKADPDLIRDVAAQQLADIVQNLAAKKRSSLSSTSTTVTFKESNSALRLRRNRTKVVYRDRMGTLTEAESPTLKEPSLSSFCDSNSCATTSTNEGAGSPRDEIDAHLRLEPGEHFNESRTPRGLNRMDSCSTKSRPVSSSSSGNSSASSCDLNADSPRSAALLYTALHRPLSLDQSKQPYKCDTLPSTSKPCPATASASSGDRRSTCSDVVLSWSAVRRGAMSDDTRPCETTPGVPPVSGIPPTGRSQQAKPLQRCTTMPYRDASLSKNGSARTTETCCACSNAQPVGDPAVGVRCCLEPVLISVDDQMHLRRIAQELVDSEQAYVNDLTDIVEGYWCAMETQSLQLDVSESELICLFSNVDEILDFSRHFCDSLTVCDLDIVKISKAFLTNTGFFQVYQDYCTSYSGMVSTLSSLLDRSSVANFLKEKQVELQHALPLGAYLLKPVQRILKYHLFLQNMLKRFRLAQDRSAADKEAIDAGKEPTEGQKITCSDNSVLSSAVDAMTSIANEINEAKRREERASRVRDIQLAFLEGGERKVLELGQCGDLILEGQFRMLGGKAATVRQLFLFEEILIVAKLRSENGLGLKDIIPCSNMMMNESISCDPLAFQFWPYDNPRNVYGFQARCFEEKRIWTRELKRLMLEKCDVKIPDHARHIIMSIDPAPDDCLQKPPSSRKLSSLTPKYLEKRRKSTDASAIDKVNKSVPKKYLRSVSSGDVLSKRNSTDVVSAAKAREKKLENFLHYRRASIDGRTPPSTFISDHQQPTATSDTLQLDSQAPSDEQLPFRRYTQRRVNRHLPRSSIQRRHRGASCAASSGATQRQSLNEETTGEIEHVRRMSKSLDSNGLLAVQSTNGLKSLGSVDEELPVHVDGQGQNAGISHANPLALSLHNGGRMLNISKNRANCQHIEKIALGQSSYSSPDDFIPNETADKTAAAEEDNESTVNEAWLAESLTANNCTRNAYHGAWPRNANSMPPAYQPDSILAHHAAKERHLNATRSLTIPSEVSPYEDGNYENLLAYLRNKSAHEAGDQVNSGGHRAKAVDCGVRFNNATASSRRPSWRKPAKFPNVLNDFSQTPSPPVGLKALRCTCYAVHNEHFFKTPIQADACVSLPLSATSTPRGVSSSEKVRGAMERLASLVSKIGQSHHKRVNKVPSHTIDDINCEDERGGLLGPKCIPRTPPSPLARAKSEGSIHICVAATTPDESHYDDFANDGVDGASTSDGLSEDLDHKCGAIYEEIADLDLERGATDGPESIILQDCEYDWLVGNGRLAENRPPSSSTSTASEPLFRTTCGGTLGRCGPLKSPTSWTEAVIVNRFQQYSDLCDGDNGHTSLDDSDSYVLKRIKDITLATEKSSAEGDGARCGPKSSPNIPITQASDLLGISTISERIRKLQETSTPISPQKPSSSSPSSIPSAFSNGSTGLSFNFSPKDWDISEARMFSRIRNPRDSFCLIEPPNDE